MNKRILAYLVDFIITCIIQAILVFTVIIIPLQNGSNENASIIVKMIAVTMCSMTYLVIRDIVGARSIGKRIMKLEIVNANDNKQASIIRRLLRNITFILGPIEIILFLLFKYRLGDRLANTKVVEKE